MPLDLNNIKLNDQLVPLKCILKFNMKLYQYTPHTYTYIYTYKNWIRIYIIMIHFKLQRRLIVLRFKSHDGLYSLYFSKKFISENLDLFDRLLAKSSTKKKKEKKISCQTSYSNTYIIGIILWFPPNYMKKSRH